jgi:hypothetical protein
MEDEEEDDDDRTDRPSDGLPPDRLSPRA